MKAVAAEGDIMSATFVVESIQQKGPAPEEIIISFGGHTMNLTEFCAFVEHEMCTPMLIHKDPRLELINNIKKLRYAETEDGRFLK